ncbi:MAG: tripartite tricarboxylate transporter TctB family protein [Rhodospirillales bacterium]|nr:tripartite tricarboxylate transporter TctB family protein [Rhodospirillales bacterium]
MRIRNIIAGLTLTALGLIYGFLTTGLPVRSLPNTPGPSFFPWIITALLLVLSVSLLVQGLRMEETEPSNGKKRPIPQALFLCLFIVYLAALPFFGFLFTSIPFFAALIVMYGERRKAWVASFAIGVPVFLLLLFRDGFSIPLPRGSLGFLLG